LDQRIQDIEIKLAWLESHLAELDAVVRTVCDQLERLRTELSELRDSTPTPERPADEKPPHY
jgi:uncharacterized coiled-coil protein SlyX